LVHTGDQWIESPAPAPRFVEVGRVTGLHGVRGKVKVAALSRDPSGMLAARTVGLNGGRDASPGAVREYEVITAHRAGGCAVFALKGIDSERAAEGLVGAVVSVRRDELPPLPEDEFYWADLIGCAVVDKGGGSLGEVVAVEPGLEEISHAAHAVEIIGGEESEPVLAGQALSGLDLLPDRMQSRIAESRWSGRGDGHGDLRV